MLSNEKFVELISEQIERFKQRTPNSRHLVERAVWSMPLGVPTNVCALSPYPVAIERGEGAHLFDVDGNEYVDYHGGFGTMVIGQNNPAVTSAIVKQASVGTHFGALTPVVVPWAEHLCERFSLDWIRFSNSGTEATMDAIRLARAFTGRTKIAKMEGGYHGSHESALVSTNMSLDGTEGPDEAPKPRPFSEGLSPRLLSGEVVILPFNNVDAARNALSHNDIAAVIIEPIMFNVGAIFPQNNYLAELRQICDQTGTLLIFDETKTCVTIAYGGAEEYFGVQPHIKTLGKGIGGGLPVGALGDTTGELLSLIEEWRVPHLGTFSGNPLTAAAGLAGLTKVLTRDAYKQLDTHHQALSNGLSRVIEKYQLPAHVVGAGAKGCIVWADTPQLLDFRDYQRRFDFKLVTLAWLYFMNNGVFLSPGGDEQWTTSVAHTSDDIDFFIEIFDSFGKYYAQHITQAV